MNIIGWILAVIIGIDMILLAALGIVTLYFRWRERHAKRETGG